jgi:ribonuclease VapC
MRQKNVVLDASAVLAWIQGEPGSDLVERHLAEGCVLGTTNLAEVIGKLVDNQHSNPEKIGEQLRNLGINLLPLSEEQAVTAGLLRKTTRAKGLSLGDRACIALAKQLNAEVLTADSAWLKLDLEIPITHIRNK